MSYKHLSIDERYTISAEYKRKTSQREIARLLGRSVSTISREIERNTGQRGYRPKQAMEKSQARRRLNSPAIGEFAMGYIEYLLSQKWSPEQIHGALTARGWQGVPSHEWIYQYVYADKARGGNLHHHLRAQKSYRKRGMIGHERRGSIIGRVSIHERSPEIDKRTRIGDFEADLVIGAQHQGVLLTLIERKTLFALLKPLPNKQAHATMQTCCDVLKPFGAHSVTFDNGKEFAKHQLLRDVNIDTYFADPYCSSQRARNENMNGLIRQFLPKGESFANLSEKTVQAIQHSLNHRPRKTLNWLTPAEMLSGIRSVALRG